MINTIDAVILCGGKGERLKSVTGDVPKVMVPISNRPFLDIVIDHLQNQGIKRFILCTGYNAHIVENYYRENNRGLIFEFSREDKPLGTGGAVKKAKSLIKANSFLVFNGDTFCAIDYGELLHFHQKQLALASMVGAKVKDNKDFGTLFLDDNNSIVSFHEKNSNITGEYINAGIYYFNKEILSLFPKEESFSLEYDFFPKLIGNRFYGFLTNEKFYDIGTPERYKEAKEDFGAP